MAKTTPARIPTPLSLRVLGYKDEDGGWVAHCLETDLVGEGGSFDVAMRRLHKVTEMQISFAIHKGNPDLVFHPAPMHVIERYQVLYSRALGSFPKTRFPDGVVGSFPVPTPTGPSEYAACG